MGVNKFWLIFGSAIAAIILFVVIWSTISSDFEKVNSDQINIPPFVQYDSIEKLYREIEKDSIDFAKIYSSLSNRFIPTDFTNNFFVVTTGVTAIDDGALLYFTIPTYTRVLVINRETEEIVANKFFNFHVSNAKIIDGYIYFVYDSRWSDEYQLGRFKFNPKEELAS